MNKNIIFILLIILIFICVNIDNIYGSNISEKFFTNNYKIILINHKNYQIVIINDSINKNNKMNKIYKIYKN